MRRKISVLVFFLLLLPSMYRAHAAYVLPYPSYMPGNKLYRVSQLFDSIGKWWYWGDIAKVKYYLRMSDKHLVEAKTLFEYKQYLLAIKALEQSSLEFGHIPAYLAKARHEGKDISGLRESVRGAAAEHINVLNILLTDLPVQYTWTPEKSQGTILNIHEELNSAIQERNQVGSSVERI